MKIEEERKAFEDWFKSQYPSLYCDFLKNNAIAVAVFVACSDSWMASVSREGHKLVPVEPTQEMVDAQDYINNDWAEDIYKAMIGACDESI